MKAVNMTALLASALIAASLPLAANDSAKEHKDKDSSYKHSSSVSAESAGVSTGVRVSKVIDADATAQDGERLGGIEDLLIDPATGEVKFVVIGRGGILGLGQDLVPVPWQGASMQSEDEFTLNVTREKIKGAPALQKDYSNLNDPSFMASVHSFYGIQSGIGAAESPGGVLEHSEASSEPAKD